MATTINVTRDHCELARDNVHAGVNPDLRFPRNVFLGTWSNFFFFDSDWMTNPGFVTHVQSFLDAEGSQCACLWKLDSEDPNEPRFFFVHMQTPSDDYGALLAGPTPGHGWLVAMERMACASGSGAWCMYCEPNNEIAVIGFRESGAFHRYSSALARVHAARFEDAIREPPLSYGFSERAMTPAWRDAFRREYAAHSG